MLQHNLSPSSQRWFYGTLFALMFLAPLLFSLTQDASITGEAIAVQDSPSSNYPFSTGEALFWGIFFILIAIAVTLFFMLSGK